MLAPAEEVEEVTTPLQAAFDAAGEEIDDTAAATKYAEIVSETACEMNEACSRVKEESIYALARLYAKGGQFDKLVDLLALATTFFGLIAKAKVAKIVRSIIEIVAEAPGDTLDVEAELCTRIIAWCVAEKRTFLRQRVESRLCAIDYEREKYADALTLVNRLLRELKKLDDKQLLVETHLSEARIHAALRNVPKAKAALTASRTNANAIYVAPRLQASIDEMSGTLHCEEADYDTAYSYFLEAYEAYDSLEDGATATTCLKYMLLCRVLVVDPRVASSASAKDHQQQGVQATAKHFAKYSGADLDSMKSVAQAARERSLKKFDEAMAKYKNELTTDVLIKHHLDLLYDRVLETNLAKIIEPFSCVEITRIAQLIDLAPLKVEKKLAQMILDKKLEGVLAQSEGQLILHTPPTVDPIYEQSVDVIKNMAEVVESLFKRAEAIDH